MQIMPSDERPEINGINKTNGRNDLMQTKLNVEGMTCSHCENAVKKAVLTISGVTEVAVDLVGKTVTVTHDQSLTAACIVKEIEEQGYDVI